MIRGQDFAPLQTYFDHCKSNSQNKTIHCLDKKHVPYGFAKKLFRLAVDTVMLGLNQSKAYVSLICVLINYKFVIAKPTILCFKFINIMKLTKRKKDDCVKAFSNFIFIQPFDEKSPPYLLYNKQRTCMCVQFLKLGCTHVFFFSISPAPTYNAQKLQRYKFQFFSFDIIIRK